MNFDWAAWHKKFEDFGISTHRAGEEDPKFPGSFPEANKTTKGADSDSKSDTEEPNVNVKGESSTASSNAKLNGSTHGWREEMEEEGADPVWQKHLDKLQASGKLKERNDGYASSHQDVRPDEETKPEDESEFVTFTYEQLQVRSVSII